MLRWDITNASWSPAGEIWSEWTSFSRNGSRSPQPRFLSACPCASKVSTNAKPRKETHTLLIFDLRRLVGPSLEQAVHSTQAEEPECSRTIALAPGSIRSARARELPCLKVQLRLQLNNSGRCIATKENTKNTGGNADCPRDVAEVRIRNVVHR